MSVATEYNAVEVFTGNGSLEIFPLAMALVSSSEVEVYRRTIADGVRDEYTLDAQYTITVLDENNLLSGSTLTTTTAGGFTSPLESTHELIVRRKTLITQATDIKPGSSLHSNTLEDAIDRLTYICQEIRADQNDLTDYDEVTQLTSITTGVTLNKANGMITTRPAIVAAGVGVTFVVTNSKVAIEDIPNVCVRTNNGNGIFQAFVIAVTNGAFTIRLYNSDPAADGTGTLVINFSLTKIR